jgi:hypothetical protein
MQLNGKTPSAHAAPLYNKRVKQDVIHAIKLEKYPDGLDVNGKLHPSSNYQYPHIQQPFSQYITRKSPNRFPSGIYTATWRHGKARKSS